MFKNELIKELKSEFFPFTSEENFEKKLSEKFFIESQNVIKKNGKKMIIVKDMSVSIIFIFNYSELIILLITDSQIKMNIQELLIESSSVTKIDIISTDKWKNENNRFLNILNCVSQNSQNPVYEYLEKGISLPLFNEDYLYSPLLWILTRNKFRGKKTYKANFIDETIKIVLNLTSKKKSIFSKDLTKYKKVLFNSMFKGLLNHKSKEYTYNKILNRRNMLFSETFFSSLLSSVKYDEEEWDLYFRTDFITDIKIEFIQFIFDIVFEKDYMDYMNRTLAYNILPSIKKNNNIFNLNLSIERSFEAMSDRYRVMLNEDIMRYMREILYDKELFTNSFSKKETLTKKLESPIFEIVLSQKDVLKQIELNKQSNIKSNDTITSEWI